MENKESRGKFPKAVPFVLASVFFERFCSGGVFGKIEFHLKNRRHKIFSIFLAILAIFLNQKLGFDSDVSTALFHINEFILYFFAIVGAIIADSWLGSFKTILWMTVLFALGSGIVAVASVDSLELPVIFVSLFGLLIIVIASGGSKTNQSVFGGNQFKLPEQERQLNQFFSIQYFVLKCGILLGQILIPVLRNDVKCFGMNNCFPLAFGVPAISMMVLFVILMSGRSFYIHMPLSGNMFVKVCDCVLVRNY